jgi:hypothetical protein
MPETLEISESVNAADLVTFNILYPGLWTSDWGKSNWSSSGISSASPCPISLCRRHIWAAVHCADGSAVRPSAQMRPVPRVPSTALSKGIDPGLPSWLAFAESQLAPSAERTSVPTAHPRHEHLCRGPHQALGKVVIFLVFGLSFFLC